MALEGSSTSEASSKASLISLTISNEGNPNIKSQKIFTHLKRKAYRPAKFIGQPLTKSSDALQISNQTNRSKNCLQSSSVDCAFDLTKSVSVPSSCKETSVKQKSTPVNVMKDPIHTASLPILPSPSTLPIGLPPAQFVSRSIAPSPKKRRRVGGMSVDKSGKVRQFRCNQCDDMFYSLRDLEGHTREMHSGYKCHLCQIAFIQRSNLQRHALRNVDFRPFECNLCGKAYYRKDHLMRHMQNTHPLFPVEQNIQVKLRSSGSLDYLRLLSADQLIITISHDEYPKNATFNVNPF